jgi:predicted DCC family thiol-disulfide oxidoreductase YuxK
MNPVPCIVLIDGDCAMCNATAAWFARRDPEGRMIFAPGRGEVARIAGEPSGGDPGTLVVWLGSRRLVRSTAALTLLRVLGGGWGWLARVGFVCPLFLRDAAYAFVARHRRRLPGRLDACTRLSPLHLAE